MDLVLIIFTLIIGIAIGYAIFYFRYADKNLIDDLRKTIADLQHQMHSNSVDTKEFDEQNRILKEKVTDLLLKNDDLTKITSELYRYYHRIKEGYAKSLELVELLKSFDKEFDDKLKIVGETRSIPIQSFTNAEVKRF